MSHIAIKLSKTDFRGGETIRGNVVLTVDRDVPARGVRLQIHGYEKSLWHTGAGRAMATHAETSTKFEDELTLFGEPKLELGKLIRDNLEGLFSRDHYPVLAAGNYDYAFSYELPKDLPGDYESPRGDVHIRYELRAYVDIPFKVDIETSEHITVYEPFDAGDDNGKIATDNKSFPMSSEGQLAVKARLDKAAYALGDTIHLELEVDNQSKHPVDGITVCLRQIEHLAAGSNSTERTTDICELEYPDKVLVAHTSKTHSIDYKIEPTLYPTLRSGKLVQVSYQLVASFDIPWARDLHVAVPITLYEEPGKPGGA